MNISGENVTVFLVKFGIELTLPAETEYVYASNSLLSE